MGENRIERMSGLLVDVMDSGAQVSEGVCLLGRPLLGLLVPAVNGTAGINVEFSIDEGTTWHDLLEDDGSTEAVELGATGTAHGISANDLAPLAGYCGHEVRVRLVIGTAQTAEREFTWISVG
ncbi:MAG: hypothetical protein GWO24_21910 [Akkermansiaceae bacterium]|nr:hypothetical protein [Akkermansiaceae bacterium]